MKSVVITGAGGFIGKALVSDFLNDGYEVFGVVKDARKIDQLPKHVGIHPIICDFTDYKNLSSYINTDIEYFIHLAWRGVSGAESRNISVQISNIEAACIALEQANILNTKRFLFVGSSYQYRMEAYIQDGQMMFTRKNIYGLAKQAATDLLRAKSIENDMFFNSALFTNVFGVGDCSMRSTNVFIKQLLRGEDLILIDGTHKHDWTYIDDAVRAIRTILERGGNRKSYYVGRRELITFRKIITEVRDIVNPSVNLKFGYYDDKGYIDYSFVDLDELYRDTGFECKANFRESILKTTQWIKHYMESRYYKGKIFTGGTSQD